MFAAECNTNANGEHSAQPLGGGGELAKYKCLHKICLHKNRLPNALVEEVEGGLNNLKIKLFVVFIFIMTFLHKCEILECIVGFYPKVFYLTHIVALYTFICYYLI